MAKRPTDIDSYIAAAQPFARPILVKLRSLFRKADLRLEEELKWGHPSFVYKGIVGGMAAFKQHVSWGLWKGALLKDPAGAIGSAASSVMGAGKLTAVSELPPDKVVIDLIRQGVELNDKGVKLPSRSGKTKRPPLKTPPELSTALKKNAKAAATFEAFSPSHKREYIEWITEAKQDVTRERRLAQAIEWMAQGKARNWKYMNC